MSSDNSNSEKMKYNSENSEMDENKATFRDKDEYYWSNWLKKDLGDKLDKIKKLVEQLIINTEDIPQVAFFTPHGIDHFKAVEDNLHKLIPREHHENLGESEKYFLLGGAWLHDLGMIRGIFSEKEEICKTDYVIREEHHFRSEKYIIEKHRSIGVDETEAPVFAWLAYYHRRRTLINDCPREITIPVHGKIRVRLLASYLRLADALHVDNSRVPQHYYAIMLAYNIPSKSKLHWLKSKFIIGIDVDTYFKTITVHFRKPPLSDDEVLVSETIENIFKEILQDLKDELESVETVLFDGMITYFLKIRQKIHILPFPQSLLNDFKNVFASYQHFDNPSSSALFKLVLKSVKGIVVAKEESDCKSVTGDGGAEEVIKKIYYFLEDINENVLSTRACHTGLLNLVKQIREFIDNINKREPDCLTKISTWVDEQLLGFEIKRRALRIHAKKYFRNEYLLNRGKITDVNPEENKKINILLYGFSELSIKTLCGIRDAIVDEIKKARQSDASKENILENQDKVITDIAIKLGDKTQKGEYAYKLREASKYKIFNHQIDLEGVASDWMNLFCCEGQPKNHTAPYGKIIHHDGINYSKSLSKRNFRNINIIPDAVAGTLLSYNKNRKNQGKNKRSYPKIDLIIVGANGFTNNDFVHSAGHAMIISCANFIKNTIDEKENHPIIILALLTDKYSANPKFISKEDKGAPPFVNVHGWRFRYHFQDEIASRCKTFFCQDENLKSELLSDKNISFYNPRQDLIDIESVDIVVSEKGYMVINEHIDNSLGKKLGEIISSGNYSKA